MTDSNNNHREYMMEKYRDFWQTVECNYRAGHISRAEAISKVDAYLICMVDSSIISYESGSKRLHEFIRSLDFKGIGWYKMKQFSVVYYTYDDKEKLLLTTDDYMEASEFALDAFKTHGHKHILIRDNNHYGKAIFMIKENFTRGN